MIKAVLFDVDGVLISSFEANFKFCHDLFAKAGYDRELTREDYSKMFHLSLYHVILRFIGSSDMARVKEIFEMGRNRDVRYPSELVEITKGAAGTISRLSEKYKLAIVTSRIRGGVFELPQLKPLEKYFKSVICFEDTEKHKPDPDPLMLAAKKLDTDIGEAVYIGDSKTDVMAAKSANMKIIAFTKNDVGKVDAQTSTFDELSSLIERL